MSTGYTFRNYTIPPHMLASLEAYIERGYPPGGFLGAVLENDLMGALGKADEVNLANLPAYAGYLYNEAPAGCYGSKEAVDQWLMKKQEAA